MEERRPGLTVIIPAFNVAKWLDRLLKTVTPWADEVIVCDSFSTDNTANIAKENKVVFIQHAYINSATQKNWIIPQASHPWVMVIDADELPEPALLTEIDLFLRNADSLTDMAFIPRKNMIWGELLGKGINYPDYQSRLFRRDKGKYQDKAVHAQVEVPGKIVYLKNALLHDDFKNTSTWWLRNDRYYEYELQELIKHNKRWSFTLQYLKPLYVFIKMYIGKGYFLHGFKGFYVCFQWAIYYFFVGARLYEYEYLNKKGS